MVKNCENNQNTHILFYLVVEGTYFRYFHNNIARQCKYKSNVYKYNIPDFFSSTPGG